MRSLTAHVREPDGHDRLPFHPACPICRQTRVTGTVTAAGMVSPRTQALLAAGLLAVSSTAPAASAFAAEQDQQQDGSAPVAQGGTPDAADSPDFDPGGDTTDLTDSAPALPQTQAPADPGEEDTGPVDQAPTANPDDPVVDAGDGSDTTPAQPPAATSGDSATPATPPPATSATPPPATPTPSPDTGASTPAPAPAEAVPAPPAASAPSSRARRSARGAARHRRTRRPAHEIHHSLAPAPASTAQVSATTPSTTEPTPAPVTAVVGDRARPGDRTHTVLGGESLWSIATDLLGGQSTPARVAREVHRLWQLNRARIGTGDPDLLMVGTRLTLR